MSDLKKKAEEVRRKMTQVDVGPQEAAQYAHRYALEAQAEALEEAANLIRQFDSVGAGWIDLKAARLRREAEGR